MWRVLLYMPVATPPSCPASAAGLDGFGTIECSTQIAGRLRPHHLPEIPNFDEWTSNTSVPLVGGDQVVHVARGDMAHLGVSGSSRFYVLPALVTREEVQSILALVNGSDAPVLDADPDSVDGMTSHEIFVDNDELRAGMLRHRPTAAPVPGKDVDERELAARRPLREKLRRIMQPILDERITAFVRQQYPESCGRAKACVHPVLLSHPALPQWRAPGARRARVRVS